MACSQIVSAQPSIVSVELVVWMHFEFLSTCLLRISLREEIEWSQVGIHDFSRVKYLSRFCLLGIKKRMITPVLSPVFHPQAACLNMCLEPTS